MRKVTLAERENPARARIEERQAETVARSVRTESRPPGADLPPEVLTLVRDRLGLNLGDVRMRTDDEGARAVAANAFTVGREIVFANGQYAPHTEAGQRLIAHELTHVAQQTAHGEEKVQRQPSSADEATAQTPENRLLLAQENMGLATTDFASALTSVDERRALRAGLMVVAHWDNADEAAQEIVPTDVPLDEAVCQKYNLDENQQRVFDEIRDSALKALTLQRFGGHPVVYGAEEVVPVAEEDVTAQLVAQLQQVTWVVKDTAALIAILDQDEVPEEQQWTAIGLLRQHMNPIQFSWMIAAVDDAGVGSVFDSFESEPMDAFYALLGASEGMIRAGLGDDPTAEAPLYQVLAAERKIRLLQPLTMEELSAELYGSRSGWRRALIPYNRGRLEGVEETTWLPTGTELMFEPTIANAGIQTMVAAADMAMAELRRAGTEPTLTSDAPGQPATIGNSLAFSVRWIASGDGYANVAWWLENDPIAVRDAGLPERVDYATESLSQGVETTTWNLTAGAVGNHTIHADVTMPDGTVRHLSVVQVVMTPEERLDVGQETDRRDPFTPEAFLVRLVEERDSATGEQREQLDEQIEAIRENLEDMKGPEHTHGLHSLDAIYVSTTGAPIVARLHVYAGRDPSWFDSRDSHYHLIDFTLGGASQYYGEGSRNADAIENLLREFADDAPYPDGLIRFPSTGQLDLFGTSQSLTFPTDGGEMTASVLRALSMVALGVGVVASVALQPEVAVPAFWVSGALAGAGGVADLSQRLEHGEFQWDLQTGMDLMDIAGAALTLGASSAATTTIRGVGRFSLRGTIQTGIGVAQVGIMGGIHVAAIAAAVESGDEAAIARAVAHAIADGALILIVHRASARVSGGGEPRRAADATPTDQARAGEPTPMERNTPGAIHDTWVADMLRTSAADRPRVEPSPDGVGPPAPIDTPERAYGEYERTLANTDHKVEVAIERNTASGEYRVQTGTAHELPPVEPGWESVMHFHPNEGNVLSRRMPAPADVESAQTAARAAGRPMTEFVEYPLPGGGRGRTAYTVEPSSSRVTIEFRGSDGAPVRRPYESIGDYSSSYHSRTTYVEPGSPEYEWVVQDLESYYLGTAAPGRRTATGAASVPPPVSPEVRRLTPGYTAVRMEGPRLATIASAPGPHNLGPGEILVDPNGLATWRDPQGRIHSEHPILPAGIGRSAAPNYNTSMPAASTLAPAIASARPGWNAAELDWAHGVGQSYGIESPIDLMLAPRAFNQTAENIFVEGFDRAIRREIPGMRMVRSVVSRPIDPSHPQLSMVLAERTYRIDAIAPDGSRILVYEVSMRPAANGSLDLRYLRDHITLGTDPRVAGVVEAVGNARRLSRSMTERN